MTAQVLVFPVTSCNSDRNSRSFKLGPYCRVWLCLASHQVWNKSFTSVATQASVKGYCIKSCRHSFLPWILFAWITPPPKKNKQKTTTTTNKQTQNKTKTNKPKTTTKNQQKTKQKQTWATTNQLVVAEQYTEFHPNAPRTLWDDRFRSFRCFALLWPLVKTGSLS